MKTNSASFETRIVLFGNQLIDRLCRAAISFIRFWNDRRQPRRDTLSYKKACKAMKICRIRIVSVHTVGPMNVNVNKAGKNSGTIEFDRVHIVSGRFQRNYLRS
jgi:hypothetical protein